MNGEKRDPLDEVMFHQRGSPAEQGWIPSVQSGTELDAALCAQPLVAAQNTSQQMPQERGQLSALLLFLFSTWGSRVLETGRPELRCFPPGLVDLPKHILSSQALALLLHLCQLEHLELLATGKIATGRKGEILRKKGKSPPTRSRGGTGSWNGQGAAF